MTWAKLDDRMHDDPRTERAGLEAMGLWAIALSYMGDYATNGVISKERIRKFAGRSGHWLAERLVKAGWWVRSDGGYTLVDWELYLIPNVGTNLGRRSAEPRAKVGRTSGESTHEPPPVRGDVHETDGPRESRGETPRAGARPDPDPTRPDPERSEDQTPLPPKGAQVSILGMADGGGHSEPPKVKKRAKAVPPELSLEALSPAERDTVEAISRDPTLSKTTKHVAQLARDLAHAAPCVVVAGEIPKAGLWVRSNQPRPNGNAFLAKWVGRAQADAVRAGIKPIGPKLVAPPPSPPDPAFLERVERMNAERGRPATMADLEAELDKIGRSDTYLAATAGT